MAEELSPEMADAAARQITGGCIAWGEGGIYDFENPNPEIITLEDMAYALAYTVRWRGQARQGGRRCFYGVGQHCVIGAQELRLAGYGPEHALAFLVHEPDEVVLPDFPGPVKKLLPGFRELANRQGDALLQRFGLTIPDPDLIKRWDIRMMVTEKRDLLTGHEGDRFHTSSHDPIAEAEFPPFERRIIPYHHPDRAAVEWLEAYTALSSALTSTTGN